MAELRPFCPTCTCLEITFSELAEGSGGRAAKCELCGWSGNEQDLVLVSSAEDFWDIERVGQVLLQVFTKHAIGPLIQALEHIGMVETEDIEGKEIIAKKTMEGALVALFDAAQEAYLLRAKKANESEKTEEVTS